MTDCHADRHAALQNHGQAEFLATLKTRLDPLITPHPLGKLNEEDAPTNYQFIDPSMVVPKIARK